MLWAYFNYSSSSIILLWLAEEFDNELFFEGVDGFVWMERNFGQVWGLCIFVNTNITIEFLNIISNQYNYNLIKFVFRILLINKWINDSMYYQIINESQV